MTRFSAACLVLIALVGTPAAAKPIIRKVTPNHGHYIISFNPEFRGNAATALASELSHRHGGAARHVFTDPPGMVIQLNDRAAEAISNDPRISQVEEEAIGRLSLTQSPAPWHLDRVDQHSGLLDQKFSACTGGINVLAYVVDTGVRGTHREFRWTDTNTTSRVEPGYEAYSGWPGTANNPCPQTSSCPERTCTNAGHGTAVASVLGGYSYGAAKSVTIVPVRVTSCDGKPFEGDVIKGINWVSADFKARRADPTRARPAVVNMSMEFDVVAGSPLSALEKSIDDLITSTNMTVVVAAGNMNANVESTSPARRSWVRGGRVIAVGGSAPGDKRWICGQDANDDPCGDFVKGSNYGGVDIFAPARLVQSAGITELCRTTCTGDYMMSDTADRLLARSGTSFAAPLVAARAARVIEGSVPGGQDPYSIYVSVISDPSTMNETASAPLFQSPPRLIFHPKGFSQNCF